MTKLTRDDLFLLRDACNHAIVHCEPKYKKDYQDMFRKLRLMIEEMDKQSND